MRKCLQQGGRIPRLNPVFHPDHLLRIRYHLAVIKRVQMHHMSQGVFGHLISLPITYNFGLQKVIDQGARGMLDMIGLLQSRHLSLKFPPALRINRRMPPQAFKGRFTVLPGGHDLLRAD